MGSGRAGVAGQQLAAAGYLVSGRDGGLQGDVKGQRDGSGDRRNGRIGNRVRQRMKDASGLILIPQDLSVLPAIFLGGSFLGNGWKRNVESCDEREYCTRGG